MSAASFVLSFRFADRVSPLLPIAWTLSGALRQMREGWHIFLSIAASLLYSQINVIVFGAVAGPVQAGLLFGAQKLQHTSKSVIGPLGGAIYPRINNLLVENPDHAIHLMKRLLFVQGLMSFGILVVLFVGAPYLTVIFFGQDFAAATPAVGILSGTVFLSGLTNVLGTQIMPHSGCSALSCAFSSALACSISSPSVLCATGAAISIFLTELIVTIAMGFVVWRAGILSKKAAQLDL